MAKHTENLLKLIFITISTLIFTILLCTTGKYIFSWFTPYTYYFFLAASVIVLIFFGIFFLIAFKQSKKAAIGYTYTDNTCNLLENMIFDCKDTKKELCNNFSKAFQYRLKLENSQNIMKTGYEVVTLLLVCLTYFLGYVIFPKYAIQLSFSTIAFLIVYVRRYINNLKCLLEFTYTYSMNKVYSNEFNKVMKGGNNA